MPSAPHIDPERIGTIDLANPLDRRRALKLLAGLGVVSVAAACGSNGSSSSESNAAGSTTTSGGASSTTPTTATPTTTTSSEPIPEETAGPYPGDGSNGTNVLDDAGVVRRDIRSSFGDASGVAGGVPITLTLTVLDSATGGAWPGAAVYVWHCDREGRYSMYTQGAENENYLRGVQEADARGDVTFTSIFPAAYQGRWPHIHFEVYPTLSDATSTGTPTTTSQLALPEAVCNDVYATEGYEASIGNLARTSLDGDMVFRDGYDTQLASVDGSVDHGYTVALRVPV